MFVLMYKSPPGQVVRATGIVTCIRYRLDKHFDKYKLSAINMEKAAVIEEQESTAFDILEEGTAKILLKKKNIFYNPVQEFNRDLSIAVLSQYSKEQSRKNNEKLDAKKETLQGGLRILEALSATGLRSIRYAKEVPGVSEIIANDISIKAVEAMKNNVIYNKVENIVIPNVNDAIMVMYQNRNSKFDVIDIDPYGCPSIFLDAAVQSVKDDGLLLVTATDMAVLAGNSPETCYVKYGAIALKSKSCHEMALRILLQHVASHAARYGRVIIPVLSISADFYIRVFVKIRTSQAACKRNTSNLGLVYQCKGCESLTIQPLGIIMPNNIYKLPQVPSVDQLCTFCKHKHYMGGPIWIGPLHDKEFVRQILMQIDSEENNHLKTLKTIKRIQGILHLIEEELENPLYYKLDCLMSTIKSNIPPMVQFRSALLNAGYKVSYSHANKISVKTDAPNHVIWDIVRAWEKQNPVKREKFELHSAGLAILNGEIATDVSFTRHKDAVPFSQQQRLTRFQINPSAYWGPGTKSTTIIQNERQQNKKEKNQNKKRKRKQSNSETQKTEKRKNIEEDST